MLFHKVYCQSSLHCMLYHFTCMHSADSDKTKGIFITPVVQPFVKPKGNITLGTQIYARVHVLIHMSIRGLSFYMSWP